MAMIVSGRRLIVVAAALLIGALAVRPLARRVALHGVAVDAVEVVGLEGSDRGWLGRVGEAVKAGEEAAVGGSVTLRLKARNRRPVPVWVRSAQFRVWAGDHEVGHGTWTPASGAQLFWPGKDETVEVRLDGDSAALRAVGLRYMEGKQVDGDGRGEVEAGFPPVVLTLPFEVHVSTSRKAAK